MLDSFLSWFARNRLSIAVVVVFAALALLAYHIHISTDRFAQKYRDYAVLANVSDIGADVPGAQNNPVRMQINDALTQVLANKMTDAQRLALAQHGLELLTFSNKQIDAISPKLDAADASAKEMAASVDFVTSTFAKGLPQKIINEAKERSAAIKDIRAYSYRANADTIRIFEHIVDDKGALPNSYIAELNSSIPAEEQNFNDRQNRYYDLQNIGDEIKLDFADFAKRFSIKNTGE